MAEGIVTDPAAGGAGTDLGNHVARAALGMKGAASRMLRPGDPDVDDATQHMLLRLVKAPGGIHAVAPGAVTAWLASRAANEARNLRRRRARREAVVVPASALAPGVIESVAAGGGLAADERADLKAILSRLSPEDRSLLVMADGLEMDCAEIARSLGQRRETVRDHLCRARRRVRELTREMAPDPETKTHKADG